MKNDRLKLTDEQRSLAIAETIRYFAEERDEEIGELAAGFILDFFLERVGPLVYNLALDDAAGWFTQRLEDLEADYRSLRIDPRR